MGTDNSYQHSCRGLPSGWPNKRVKPHSQLLNITILKFNCPVLLDLLFQYWSPRRVNAGFIIKNVCILTRVRKYDERKPEFLGNPLGFALGISLGLRLYFMVYPSSCHNTDTVFHLFLMIYWRLYCSTPGSQFPLSPSWTEAVLGHWQLPVVPQLLGVRYPVVRRTWTFFFFYKVTSKGTQWGIYWGNRTQWGAQEQSLGTQWREQ